MALRCGEQFRRRYIEDERVPPGVALGRGRSVHKSNELNMRQKVASARDLPESDLLDCTRDEYVSTFKNEGVFLTKTELPQKKQLLNAGLNEALRATRIYRKSVAPDIQPIEVERKFNIDIGLDLPLLGYMDIESKAVINDLKTTARKKGPNSINEEIQPDFYSLVRLKETGEKVTFRFNYLITRKSGNDEAQAQSKISSQRDFAALIAKMKNFCEFLKAGVFMPANPMSWWCDERYCGYWSTCRYVGNGKRQNWN
jgi:hypothetical protein